MKIIKKISILLAVLIQTNIAMSQKTLIKELPTYRNDEILTEIGSRAEVLSVSPIEIERDILFSEDTLFKIELNLNAYISQQPAYLYATAPTPPSINVATVRRIDATEMINTVFIPILQWTN